MEKTEKALQACEKVIDGIEDGTISTSSALLLCSKIARLTNDEDSFLWLQYECGGYPRGKNGYIEKEAWSIAYKNGRGYIEKDKQVVFSELASELEEEILAMQSAIGNFTTQGASAGGDNAAVAMNNLTASVSRSTSTLVGEISKAQKHLSLLKSKYYEYALKKQIELSFGNVAATIFSQYRETVDNAFSELSKDTLLRLQAIEGKIGSDNPEFYSQALTTCRRLFESASVELFNKHLPMHSSKMYTTKSGQEIDVSGDHYKNKLSAVIETLETKSARKTLVGSNIIYLLDWIDNLCDLQCKGVHSEVTLSDAKRCILQTYMCLGDILCAQ